MGAARWPRRVPKNAQPVPSRHTKCDEEAVNSCTGLVVLVMDTEINLAWRVLRRGRLPRDENVRDNARKSG